MPAPRSSATPQLTPAQSEEYAQRGYLKLEHAIPTVVLDNLIEVVSGEVDRRAQQMLENSEIANLRTGDPFAARWHEVWQQRSGEQDQFGWHSCVFSRSMYELWTDPSILDVVESLVGPEIQFNGDFWVRPKLRGEARTTVPWHQDSAYMPGTADDHLPAVWLPLVPVDAENGAMQYIPGSQRLPVQAHSEPSPGGLATPSFDPSAGNEVATLAMQPGDFIVFNNHVFHRSTVNHASSVRWSVDFRYSAAGTSMGELWHRDMCFLARSRSNPAAVANWGQVAAMWQASTHDDQP
jgi:phytanoyl-CoA hydroxylase